MLKKQGSKFNLKTKVTRSAVKGGGVTLTTEASKVCILVISCKGRKALHATCLM